MSPTKPETNERVSARAAECRCPASARLCRRPAADGGQVSDRATGRDGATVTGGRVSISDLRLAPPDTYKTADRSPPPCRYVSPSCCRRQAGVLFIFTAGRRGHCGRHGSAPPGSPRRSIQRPPDISDPFNGGTSAAHSVTA